MKPILYPAGETQFVSNGLGRLSDAVSCKVMEERNGMFELELEYPVTGIHYADIMEERIICARHDDTEDIQPFRIYKITRPMNGIVTVNARHITYQLSKVVAMPFSADNCADALQGLIDHAEGDCPFSVWTDKALNIAFDVSQPATVRSLLGGVAGSILDVYGPGEYEWDRFTVKFHASRGTNAGVMIRYGKDMTDVKKTTDTSNIWTGILPFWAGLDDNEEQTLVTLPERVIYADNVDNYVYRMVTPVDMTSYFTEKPTEEQLRSRAESYVRANAETGIPATIEISFVALWQTEEYKNIAPLQKLRLCDTVNVYHRGLGIENAAKIVSVTYNVLLERYETMTIGDVRTSLTDSIRAISAELNKETPSVTAIKNAISHATNILSGGLGGNVVINTNTDGQPIEILAMNTADITTATHILRLSKTGISVSTNGYVGPFVTVMKLNGEIGAEFIKGVLDAGLIKNGSLADQVANISWNMLTGAFKGKNMEITTLTSQTVTAGSVKADQTDAGELTASSVEAESAEIDSIKAGSVEADSVETDAMTTGSVHADSVEADTADIGSINAETIETESASTGTLEAETVSATSVSADTLSSGDGFTGAFHIPGSADTLGFTIAVRDGIITGLTEDDPPEPEEPVEPDPQEPDPQEPDPNEEGE